MRQQQQQQQQQQQPAGPASMHNKPALVLRLPVPAAGTLSCDLLIIIPSTTHKL
jgi:hypothetical protein